MRIVTTPYREYAIVILVIMVFCVATVVPSLRWMELAVSVLGGLPTAWKGITAALKKKISIEGFNTFALVIALSTTEYRSAAFIVLMLASATILDWFTTTRAHTAVEALLKLKPTTAMRERNGTVMEVAITKIATGDIVVIQTGARVPVDGVVVYGSASLNESSVTGESVVVAKTVGDTVLSSTLNEDGVIKIRATNVGKDSTIERMAALISLAATNKSQPERLADRFAAIFLPIVLALGVVAYVFTHSITVVASLFLVACADDMAVAIPLAVTAALGQAARRGVIIKGGQRVHALSHISTLVLDKTGTLTFGSMHIEQVQMEPGNDVLALWHAVAVAEKFSEHPVGRMLYREAISHVTTAPDPDTISVHRGSGIWVTSEGKEIAVGTEEVFTAHGKPIPNLVHARLDALRQEHQATVAAVVVDGALLGCLALADAVRPEAKQSLDALRTLGVKRIVMFTGDTQERADVVAAALGLDEVRASMKPEDKLRAVEELAKAGTVAMIGDGINDAPALSRADVGIAMGQGGTAVAVEAADVVILTDNLARLPEVVRLSQRTVGVIRSDMVIWGLSNLVGFALVFLGIAGLIGAAVYNFATDFLPLINSARLFRKTEKQGHQA